MRKYFLLFLITISSSCFYNAGAQKVFIDGYIIRNDGSIIHGRIESVKKDKTPSECVFKWFELARPLIYKPGEIKSFGYIHGSRYDTKRLKGKNIFIECLASGEVNLFHDGKTMYVEAKDAQFTPLSKNEVDLVLSGNVVNTSNYRDLLAQLMKTKQGFKIPANISLNQKSITSLVAMYNVSSGAGSGVYSETSQNKEYEEMSNAGKLRVSYGVTCGMTGVKYVANCQEGYVDLYLPEMSSYTFVPSAGMYMEKQLSRVKDVIDFQAELLFIRNNMYIYNIQKELSYPYLTTRSDVFINYLAFKMPLYLQFNLSQGKFVPYMSAGWFFTYFSGTSYRRNYETQDRYNVIHQYTDNSISIKDFENGWMAGFGIKYKINPKRSVFIQGRYEYGSGIYSASDPLNQRSASISILAGMKF
jgi:hypothetical protein